MHNEKKSVLITLFKTTCITNLKVSKLIRWLNILWSIIYHLHQIICIPDEERFLISAEKRVLTIWGKSESDRAGAGATGMVQSLLFVVQVFWSSSRRVISIDISIVGPPGNKHMLSACRHICSSFGVTESSSVINNEAFSCIKFDITNGWFFRRACSVKLCKYFCCRSNTHVSSLSNSCSQPGNRSVSSTKQDFFLSTCTPYMQNFKRVTD